MLKIQQTKIFLWKFIQKNTLCFVEYIKINYNNKILLNFLTKYDIILIK